MVRTAIERAIQPQDIEGLLNLKEAAQDAGDGYRAQLKQVAKQRRVHEGTLRRYVEARYELQAVEQLDLALSGGLLREPGKP